MSEAMVDLNWLCNWLEENSSGVYRPAKEAAHVIRSMQSEINDLRAVMAKAGEQEPAIVVKGGKVVGINPAQGARIEGEFYASPLPALPDGYATAPLEPTDAMIDAGVAMALQVSVHGQGGWSKYITGLYKQMIAARLKF